MRHLADGSRRREREKECRMKRRKVEKSKGKGRGKRERERRKEGGKKGICNFKMKNKKRRGVKKKKGL